jgi:hypothetical protein
MNAVYVDKAMSDDARRKALYDGDLLLYLPTPSVRELVEFTRDMVRQAFNGADPEKVQYTMPVEQYAAILAELKPKFIHHPESKRLIQGILRECGCDMEKTYFDVPRLRTSTSDNYLTTGIAYAFHPHRDTWYSAPLCQINWWFPVYDIVSENGLAFHPNYWNRSVRNGSQTYNYQEWNKESRKNAAMHIKTDTRVQPKPEEPMELEPQLRLVPPVGGIILFSGAQMHSSVPNTSGKTRFSIDFRTVNFDDLTNSVGAPNMDSMCTGTTMGDYLRGTDLEHLPEALAERYMAGHPKKAKILEAV